jgi:transposase-like protein
MIQRPHKQCAYKNAVQNGAYWRRSDYRKIKRYKCRICKKTYSSATNNPAKYQKRRDINGELIRLLASSVSLRRSAHLLGVTYKTVRKHLVFVGKQAKITLQNQRKAMPPVTAMQFDELETIEHTKLKPLSLAVAVEKDTQRILGVTVARMPAKGKIAKLSRKKYGPRADERPAKLRELIAELAPHIGKNSCIETDQLATYPPMFKTLCPTATHCTYKGQPSTIAGQGELKKGGFDPLFDINHTLAMCRANINRLIRRSWCTTKDPDRLLDHAMVFAWAHNNGITATKPCHKHAMLVRQLVTARSK